MRCGFRWCEKTAAYLIAGAKPACEWHTTEYFAETRRKPQKSLIDMVHLAAIRLRGMTHAQIETEHGFWRDRLRKAQMKVAGFISALEDKP